MLDTITNNIANLERELDKRQHCRKLIGETTLQKMVDELCISNTSYNRASRQYL